jgi:hypothetical protein
VLAGGATQPWLAMEYLDGRSLARVMAEPMLPLRRRLELLLEVCEAVEVAHRAGIVHRDLKPSNILVRPDGHPVVLDFGIARLTEERPGDSALRTLTGQLVGTPQYMSPEQLQADVGTRTPASDVYALGVIAYQLLSGQLPYDASSVSLHRAVVAVLTNEPQPLGTHTPELRGPIERIVAKAVEKRPEDRFPDAGAMAEEWRRVLEGRPIRTRGPGLLRRLMRTSRRRRREWALAAVLLVVGLAGLSWWLGSSSRTPSPRMVRARYREAERLSYRVMTLLYEGARTPDRMRAADAAADSALNLIAGLPPLAHHDLLVRKLEKDQGTADYLLGTMTSDIAPLREGINVLLDGLKMTIDTTADWRRDLQVMRDVDLDTPAEDLRGLLTSSFLAAHRLWGIRCRCVRRSAMRSRVTRTCGGDWGRRRGIPSPRTVTAGPTTTTVSPRCRRTSRASRAPRPRRGSP